MRLEGSATAQIALADTARLARLRGTTLHLQHAVDAMCHVAGFEPPAAHLGEILPRPLTSGQALMDAANALLVDQGLTMATTLDESDGGSASDCSRKLRHAASLSDLPKA